MGIHIIKMPDIGEGIAEVELVAWHVKEGEQITEDQPLADVMTDKAAVEIPSPVAGTVLALRGTLGEMMAVGAELIRIEVAGAGNAGESELAVPPSPLAGEGGGEGSIRQDALRPAGAPLIPSPSPARGEGSMAAPVAGSNTAVTPSPLAGEGRGEGAPAPAGVGAATQPAAPAPARQPGEKPLASPAVRRRAWDLGIALQFVAGSGAHGRVLHEDLDAYLRQARLAPPEAAADTRYAARTGTQELPVIGLRRKIAEKMQESKRRIPHFTYVEEVDVTELEQLRGKLNEQHGKARGKLTLLPFIARAVVLALRGFPQINARYDDDKGIVTRHAGVHLGIAAQTDAGLVVPVLRHAESRDLWGNAAEIARLAEAARSGKAARDELSGSTITLTSLGALGGIVSTPVINHPEVAIVGVNRLVEKPVVLGGQIVIRKTMNLSSSFDHRVVDGMDAARFIQAIRGLLETPATLFIE